MTTNTRKHTQKFIRRYTTGLALCGLLLTSPFTISAAVELSAIGDGLGDDGYVIRGAGTSPYSGSLLSFASTGAGDVNGDGLADTIHYLHGVDSPYGSDVRTAVVIFGKKDGLRQELSDALNGNGGFRINGVRTFYDYGSAVGAAGDFNGDGLDDVVIGNFRYDGGAGAGVVVFGKSSNTNPVNANAIAAGTSTEGFAIKGGVSGGYTGVAVTGLGDVNGDGFGDVGILTREIPYTASYGGVAVVFGRAVSGSAAISTVGSPTTPGFMILQSRLSGKGPSDVGGAGDVNGDGLDDIICSGSRNSTAYGAFVVFGKKNFTPAEMSLIDAGTSGGFFVREAVNGDIFAGRMNAAGDVNGDGLADVAITASNSNRPAIPAFELSYIVFGKSTSTLLPATSIQAGIGGFVIANDINDNYSSVARGAGDVDGDGLADLLISGTPAFGDPEDDTLYVVNGKTSTSLVRLTDVLAETGGYPVTSSSGMNAVGYAAGCIGDLNGDGLSDFMVSGPGSYGSKGAAWVIFSPDTPPLTSTYKTQNQGAVAPLRGVGLLGDHTQDVPDSRAWVGFNTGNGPGTGLSSQTTVQLTRSDAGITNLGGGSLAGVADVVWSITSNRSTSAGTVKFRYTDDEIGIIPESSLRLYRATALSGPWTQVATATFNLQKNEVRATGTVTGFFALAGDTTVPTVNVQLLSTDEEQDYGHWSVTFSEPVAPTFGTNDLTINGTIPNAPFIVGAGPNYQVLLIYNDIEGTDDMSFSITGAVMDPSGNPLSIPVTSPVHGVVNYVTGDLNKDGAFDIADVALLADFNLGLATLP